MFSLNYPEPLALRSSNLKFPLGVSFANSSGPDPVPLCHHNMSKNPSHDLTLTTIMISLTINTGEPGHDHKCEALH